MEPADKKILQKNRVKLVEEMPVEVLTHLLARQILKPDEEEGYLEIKGPSKRNTHILNDIVRKGPKAFRALAESLFAAEYQHLATLLIPDLTTDTLYNLEYYNYTNDYKATGAAGGTRERFYQPPVQKSVTEGRGDSSATNTFPVQLSPEGNVSSSVITQPQGDSEPMEFETSQSSQMSAWPVKSADEVLKMKVSKGNYTSDMTDSIQNYTIKSKPRGKALIINNRNFRSMPLRKGTDVDANHLDTLFSELGFEVENIRNLKHDNFTAKLRHYSTMNHSRYDCFIMAVLTHGINGALYTVDEKLIKVDDIQNCFTGDSCPSLTGKPKLFFIQACRGEMFDQGVEATDGSAVDPQLQSLNLKGDVDNANELAEKMFETEIDQTDAFGKQISKLPSHADMLLAYATVPGYVSWRNSERGSWFVQALTETIKEHAREEDLLSMLTMVNNQVAHAFESSSGRNKQMPAPVTMLTKKLFFFPGHYVS